MTKDIDVIIIGWRWYGSKKEVIVLGNSEASKEKEPRRYPFKKPAGPSQRLWNNMHAKWDEATCELCGTVFPKSLEGYVLCRFMGMTIVEECCGHVLDVIYRESGADMAEAYLRDFAANPLSGDFVFANSPLLFLISL